MNIQDLNLARKWRSSDFDEMIGQDLTVRIIKNSLYRNEIFPVYLLSGQRGCGKTTTGRLFGAALNCEQLNAFQSNPQQIKVPCKQCPSCKAMALHVHPDFIEIDAASHTGVEHVRTIIESASFLPVLGRRKVYLIDEAHMLSKAAFNAFLKILEEPPLSVVFFLATTEPTKIIDTVRSRCFQLFFNPVSIPEIVRHLEHICTQENIKYEKNGLHIIAEQTDGSVRDAITLLERLRLGYSAITILNVREALGMPEDRWFTELADAIVQSDEVTVRAHMKSYSLPTMSPITVWKKLVNVLLSHLDEAIKVGNKAQIARCLGLLDVCYHAEGTLIKTQSPALMLELFVFKLMSVQASIPKAIVEKSERIQQIVKKDTEVIHETVTHAVPTPWQEVVQKVMALQEPLLSSLFKQAQFMGISEQGVVTLKFGAHYTFFKDVLDSTRTQWLPIMQTAFKRDVSCVPLFEGVQSAEKKTGIVNSVPGITKVSPVIKNVPLQSVSSPRATTSVAQTERVQTLLKTFPGVVTEIKDGESL